MRLRRRLRRPERREIDHAAVGRVLPQVLVAIAFPLSLLVGLFNRSLLPPKFFYDSKTLRSRMPLGEPGSDDSFMVMGWVYRMLGAMNHYEAMQIAQMGIFALLMLTCVPWRSLRSFGPLATGGVIYALISSAVYLAQYSKESLVVVLVLLLRLLPKHWTMDLVFVTAVCVYAQYIRTYWFIIAAIYLCLRCVLPRLKNFWTLPVMALLAYETMAFGLQLAMGHPLSYFRDIVSETRTFSQDAQSAIQNYLPTENPVLGGLNAWITLLTLILPVPLLLSPNPLYLAFCLVTGGLWIGFIICLRQLIQEGMLKHDPELVRAISLIFALICAQALFEPDFGSYLRHSLPTMPLFFLVFLRYATRSASSQPSSSLTQETSHVV